MNNIDVNTWEEFEERLATISSERIRRKSTSGAYISEYLFRGQGDSNWSLITTLERFTNHPKTLEEYYRILLRTKPQVETLTGATWENVLSLEDYRKEIGSEGLLPVGKFPAYAYFVYLRHFGFPSPLLDWSRSPYVAAYFAFRDLHSTAKCVSIYVYCEYPSGNKSGSSGTPKITGLGKYVRSHRRHFQQQSEYTICTVNHVGEHTYARHEDVFKENEVDQDELWKFNIPSSERLKILKRLDQYNINAFSLFGSEESLMETLSFREILLLEPTK